MAKVLKKLLGNTEAEIFRNWNDLPNSRVTATNITLCNTSRSVVKVHLSFVVLSGLFRAGAVLSFTDIQPFETRTIEITERVLNQDDSIRGYAEVPDVIALSIDMEGVDDFEDVLP